MTLIFKWIKRLILGFFMSTITLVILYKFIPVKFTPLMFIRAYEAKSLSFEHQWIPSEDIPEVIMRAVIASEDAKFLQHNGFDWEAIKKARENNEKGKRMKGGSTISQQTAKNAFLWPARSYVRKALEAYFTVLIEFIWGKERILEVYLNSIEMGSGVYGVHAASHYWFGKEPKKLSQEEAASIAAILPNPREYKAKNSSRYVSRRKQKILREMNRTYKINFNDKGKKD